LVCNHSIIFRLALAVGLPLILTFTAACGGNGGASPSPSSDPLQAQRGATLYAQNCQSCHGDAYSGQGRVSGVPVHGPSGHTWHHADGQLADIILGRLDYPGRRMPSFAATLTKSEVSDILAYFKPLWTPEQRDFQAEVSRNWDAQFSTPTPGLSVGGSLP